VLAHGGEGGVCDEKDSEKIHSLTREGQAETLEGKTHLSLRKPSSVKRTEGIEI